MTTTHAGEDVLTFILPGSWLRIPLAEPDARKEAISRAALVAFGRSDEHASLRQAFRQELTRAAVASADAGASGWYIASQIIEGVPLPVTLTVTLSEPIIALSRNNERNLLLLQTTMSHFEKSGWVEDPWHDEIGGSVVARRAKTTAPTSEVSDLTTLPTSPTYTVMYWLTVPHEPRIATLAFGTTQPTLRSSLLELFDAVVSSVRFPHSETQPDTLPLDGER